MEMLAHLKTRLSSVQSISSVQNQVQGSSTSSVSSFSFVSSVSLFSFVSSFLPSIFLLFHLFLLFQVFWFPFERRSGVFPVIFFMVYSTVAGRMLKCFNKSLYNTDVDGVSLVPLGLARIFLIPAGDTFKVDLNCHL